MSKYVFLNDDDDNTNGVVDMNESPVNNEDDLILVNVLFNVVKLRISDQTDQSFRK